MKKSPTKEQGSVTQTVTFSSNVSTTARVRTIFSDKEDEEAQKKRENYIQKGVKVASERGFKTNPKFAEDQAPLGETPGSVYEKYANSVDLINQILDGAIKQNEALLQEKQELLALVGELHEEMEFLNEEAKKAEKKIENLELQCNDMSKKQRVLWAVVTGNNKTTKTQSKKKTEEQDPADTVIDYQQQSFKNNS